MTCYSILLIGSNIFALVLFRGCFSTLIVTMTLVVLDTIMLTTQLQLNIAKAVVKGGIHISTFFFSGEPQIFTGSGDLGKVMEFLNLKHHMHRLDLQRIFFQFFDLFSDITFQG